MSDFPAISDYELPMETPPCDEQCELPHKIHMSPGGIGYMKRTVPLVRSRDREGQPPEVTVRNGVVSAKRVVPFDRRKANWRNP